MPTKRDSVILDVESEVSNIMILLENPRNEINLPAIKVHAKLIIQAIERLE